MTVPRNFVWKTSLMLIAFIIHLGVVSTDSNGATIGVCDSGCDYTSIQTAIDNAVAGDTIDIYSGTYTETGITVDKNLTLSGDGAGSTVVQAAAAEATAADRVFHIAAGVTATLENMTIRYGYPATHGGGILNEGTMLTVDNCVVSHNRFSAAGQQWGGGIYSTGNLTINNSTICDNIGASDDDGGGVFFNDAGSELVITNSTISDNTNWNYGAGVLVYNASSAIMTNSTISGNTGDAAGEGIWNDGTLSISFSTITGNSTTGSYGGIYVPGGTTNLKNTIIADNTDSGTVPDVGGGGTFNSLGGNVIRDNTGSEAAFPDGLPNANGDYVGTGASPLDPLLRALADNGGPTDTHALKSGSPAINAANGCTDASGDDVTTDQRGYTRPSSNCDSGSYDTDAVAPSRDTDSVAPPQGGGSSFCFIRAMMN